jgi:hypothetical protein
VKPHEEKTEVPHLVQLPGHMVGPTFPSWALLPLSLALQMHHNIKSIIYLTPSTRSKNRALKQNTRKKSTNRKDRRGDTAVSAHRCPFDSIDIIFFIKIMKE